MGIITYHTQSNIGKIAPKLIMNTKTYDFISKSKIIHNSSYDYSLVEYYNNYTKVKIICPSHGVFECTPNNHLSKKSACPSCAKNKLSKLFANSKENVINVFKKIHGYKYDYSLVNYINTNTNVDIICPIHGKFSQKPKLHLKGCECPKCSDTRSSKEIFINKATSKHGSRYDYSMVNYVNNYTKVDILCNQHGVFKQKPTSHINGCGCPICYKESLFHTTEVFIELAKKVHKNKYDYKYLKYVDSKTKVVITCPKHGEFNQKPNNHLNGSGCPSCNTSKGELMIKGFLDDNLINYIQQHSFPNCRYKLPLKFDFYLPDYNTCIEYDGVQHFRPHNLDKSGIEFERTKKCDEIKDNYCKKNNIKLIRIKYNDNYDLYELFIKNNISVR